MPVRRRNWTDTHVGPYELPQRASSLRVSFFEDSQPPMSQQTLQPLAEASGAG
jgi:hypothetical protein